MEKSHPNQSIFTRVFPGQELLGLLGHAIGEWCGGQPAFEETFDSREAAEDEGAMMLSFLVMRPTNDFPMPTEEEREQLRRWTAPFDKAFWHSGRKANKGKKATPKAPLSLDTVRRAYPTCFEPVEGILGLMVRDFGVIVHCDRDEDGNAIESQWIATVKPRGGTEILVQAVINVAMHNVGPCLIHWEGCDPDRGLRPLLDVLKKSFGDSVGLELSKWKVEESEKDQAARGRSPFKILPSESAPILWLEPDRSLDNRRAALIQRTDGEGEDVFFTVTLGPIQNVSEYLKLRESMLITDIVEADHLLLLGLQRLVECYFTRGNGSYSAKLEGAGAAQCEGEARQNAE